MLYLLQFVKQTEAVFCQTWDVLWNCKWRNGLVTSHKPAFCGSEWGTVCIIQGLVIHVLQAFVSSGACPAKSCHWKELQVYIFATSVSYSVVSLMYAAITFLSGMAVISSFISTSRGLSATMMDHFSKLQRMPPTVDSRHSEFYFAIYHVNVQPLCHKTSRDPVFHVAFAFAI